MTREEILAMETGRELDALIAERLFGWRRIKGPKFDYDGPCESGDVLIPPTIVNDDEAFQMMPPRGSIPFYYFVNRKWSTDISAAWEVVEKMKRNGWSVSITTWGNDKLERSEWQDKWKVVFGFEKGPYVFLSDSIAEAASKAALLAVLDI